jgi:hypothetical protein
MPFGRQGWKNGKVIGYMGHGSVPCYISLAVQQFLLNNLIPTILQPPYSSGFTPYSF